MKAPNKAYIFIEELGDVFMLNANTLDNGGEQYIRKDYLLEWLDGKLTIEGATEGFVGGYDSALKDVIDKLNEI